MIFFVLHNRNIGILERARRLSLAYTLKLKRFPETSTYLFSIFVLSLLLLFGVVDWILWILKIREHHVQPAFATIAKNYTGRAKSGLSLFFATLCVIDIFGVFPIITLPRAIIQCGWLGIPLVVLVFGLQIYTAGLLGKSWIIATTLDPQLTRKNRYPLAAVTELTLGPFARRCVTVLLNLTVFGGGIPSLLVASQNLQLFGLKVSAEEFNLSFCYWLLIVGILLCPIMWLGSPRDMKWLAMSSAVVVILTAVLTWWCIAMDDVITDSEPVPIWPPWERFISGYAILAFQFDVHPTLMTIQVDMRQPKDISKAVISSFICVLFAISTCLAAWKYGDETTANVLQLVPGGSATRAAILLAALQLCLSSAVGHSALFQHIEDTLHVQRSFGWKRCVTRSALVFLAVALGESVPRFDIVMALIGGSLTGPLVFILPPLMYSRIKKLEAAALRCTPTPDVISPSQRHGGSDVVADPKVHSQSVHYGFKFDAKTDLTSRDSYVYYDNGDSSDQSDDEGETGGQKGQPIHLDVSKPVVSIRKGGNRSTGISRAVYLSKNKYQGLIDWFGYFIVTMGVILTISATYINVRNTIRFVEFTPPCIANVSAAAKGLDYH